MIVQLEEVTEHGKVIISSSTIDVSITAIYSDLKRTQLLIEQLKSTGYVHRLNEGHHQFLNVEETFRFYKNLGEHPLSVEELLQLFGLQSERKTKVKKLTESSKNLISFLRPYLYTKNLLILEEPFNRLEEAARQTMVQLLHKITAQEKSLLLIGGNLEELLLLTEDIYRIDHSGIHKMDFHEEIMEPTSVEEPTIKIEKIQTKHNDKTILFNPPEIDYIESIDGTVYVNVAGIGYSCSLTLQELEKRLRAYGFYRCHRSYIVNLQKVREIITWTKNSYSLKLNIQEEVIIPLSRNKLSELKELIGIL